MTDSAIAFFEGKFVPLSDAKISVQVHGFNYGTAIFEGPSGFKISANESTLKLLFTFNVLNLAIASSNS